MAARGLGKGLEAIIPVGENNIINTKKENDQNNKSRAK
jgi:hypothetical protein